MTNIPEKYHPLNLCHLYYVRGDFINNKNYLIKIFIESKKNKALILAIFIMQSIIAICTSYSATLFGYTVDFGIKGDYSKILRLLILIISLVIIIIAVNIIQSILVSITTENIALYLRKKVFYIINNVKIPVLDEKLRLGDLSSRLNSDLESLSTIISSIINWYLWVIISAIISFVFCLKLSWQITALYFIIVPFFILFANNISKPIENQQKNIADSMGLAMNIATEGIKSIEIIKSFNSENFISNKFGKYIDESIQSNKLSEKIGMKMTMTKYLVNLILLFILFLIGHNFIKSNVITVGKFIAFVSLSANVRTFIELIDSILIAFRQGNALSKRLYEFMDFELETDNCNLNNNYISPEDYITINNLNFGYENKKNILTNVSIKVEKGKKIGIVGSSGSGKTSLIKLICKFYDIQDGEIIIFGKNIRNWEYNELRKKISIVTQVPYLFDGTIYDNVLYGNEKATKEEIINALKDAELWDYVQGLDDGVNSYIGESGAFLSGGQKQRLTIARALLKNAQLVLLDEPTASLDIHAEICIQKALNHLLNDKSAIIISHRYNTLKNVDYIYCLDNGIIIEEGTPESLVNKRGYFYDFKKAQEKDIELVR